MHRLFRHSHFWEKILNSDVFFFYLMQVWERIHDKTNGGCQSDLPEPEYKQWLQHRKMERSNKVVKEDLKNVVPRI